MNATYYLPVSCSIVVTCFLPSDVQNSKVLHTVGNIYNTWIESCCLIWPNTKFQDIFGELCFRQSKDLRQKVLGKCSQTSPGHSVQLIKFMSFILSAQVWRTHWAYESISTWYKNNSVTYSPILSSLNASIPSGTQWKWKLSCCGSLSAGGCCMSVDANASRMLQTIHTCCSAGRKVGKGQELEWYRGRQSWWPSDLKPNMAHYSLVTPKLLVAALKHHRILCGTWKPEEGS